MRYAVVAASLLTLSASSAAFAAPPDGFPPDGLAALSPLMAGMMGGVACNRTIDWNAGGKFLRDKLGDKTAINADGVSYVVWMAYAQQSMQLEVGAIPSDKAGRRKYCASMTAAFGPNGTDIKGLLSED